MRVGERIYFKAEDSNSLYVQFHRPEVLDVRIDTIPDLKVERAKEHSDFGFSIVRP